MVDSDSHSSAMSSQGIRGPPYRFIHGNTKEVLNMRTTTMSRPMDLSHNIFPRLQPHLHSWLDIYERKFLTWNGPQAQLVIAESEYAREILNDKEKIYPKVDAEGFLKKLFGDGLATSKGEKWAKQSVWPVILNPRSSSGGSVIAQPSYPNLHSERTTKTWSGLPRQNPPARG